MSEFDRFRRLLEGAPASSDSNYAYRRSVYEEELGEPDQVFADPDAASPDAIEILAYARDFSPYEDEEDEGYILLTNGMSERRMTMPQDAGEAPPRAEIMWYVREPAEEFVANLRWLARYPFVDNTWFGIGHRIPMPEPPVSGTDFKTFLLLTPIIEPDQRIADALQIGGDPVEILTVNLISDAEYDAIKSEGLDPFLDLLDDEDYPPIFDPERESYY